MHNANNWQVRTLCEILPRLQTTNCLVIITKYTLHYIGRFYVAPRCLKTCGELGTVGESWIVLKSTKITGVWSQSHHFTSQYHEVHQ